MMQVASLSLHMAQNHRARLLARRVLHQHLRNISKQNNGASGFTLIELLIVVIIIGVLSSIALPAFLNQQGRAKVVAGQTAAMDAARACASAQVTGNQSDFTPPTGVTGTCNASGTASTFVATNAAFGTTTPAEATVAAAGSVALSACAAAGGWTVGTVPVCTPVKA